MIHKAYRFRLYPTEKQKKEIDKTLGCVRYVYNHFLREWNEQYDTYGRGLNFAYCSSQLPKLKQKEGMEWLKKADSTSLQMAVKQLSDAFIYFYRYQVRMPRARNKNAYYQRFASKQVMDNIKVERDKVRIPKIGWVKFKPSQSIKGEITTLTVTKEATGRYYVSIMTRFEQEWRPPKPDVVVVMPTEDGLLTSDGVLYQNDYLTPERRERIVREQKKQDRMRELALKSGKQLSQAKNYQKQCRKVARLYADVTNHSEDFLHKVTTELVKEYGAICIPKYRFQKNLPIFFTESAKTISWESFVHKLSYKCKWYGRIFQILDFEAAEHEKDIEWQMAEFVKRANKQVYTIDKYRRQLSGELSTQMAAKSVASQQHNS